MRTAISPTAFDAFAAAYDDDFTHSLLGQLLRPRVWDILAQHFSAGQHVLELTCGTGEDALWLTRRGVHVTATDGSAAMVRQAEAKAEAEEQRSRGAGEQGSIEVKQVRCKKCLRDIS
ncbi:MAG: class I SAM-dependent methyltransferase, partial [Anaerolineales bacterium]|nr:class I SAM-dependent methyltransferase [Anaerolineales bacterium]